MRVRVTVVVGKRGSGGSCSFGEEASLDMVVEGEEVRGGRGGSGRDLEEWRSLKVQQQE